jgi:hypothetical protein
MAYFPNGQAGLYLDEQCMDCLHDDPDVGCPIAFIQMEYNYTQLDKGQEQLREALNYLVNEKGDCQLKPLINKEKSANMNHPALKRPLVFGDDEQINALKGK